jgi:hypothetical protein
MKSLTHFVIQAVKKVKPVLIDVLPVHGKHSQADEKIPAVTTQPVHGRHSYPPDDIQENNQFYDWANQNHNTHIGDDLDRIEDVLHVHYDHRKLPSPRHLEHLKAYSFGSKMLNRRLLSSADSIDPKAEISSAGYGNKVRHLDEALSFYKTPHNLEVFHGAGFDPSEYAKGHPEGLVKFPTYLSTSLDKHMALGFAKERATGYPHILHIHVPEGHPGFHIGRHGNYSDEREFLLPRNTVMKIHPQPTVFRDGNTDIMHVWKATPQGK